MPVQSSMASLSSRRVSATNACPGSIWLLDTRLHTNICESPSSRALSLSRSRFVFCVAPFSISTNSGLVSSLPACSLAGLT
ncbi:hypothetical protein BpHYR1_031004 [Brachionus plicatilis]|uniref:Uncharacterized protein n=1 Tax=Brachionus plicatilis TaxID=10195 RepID=A0A3M7SUP4_BRAPC|nr:hypothetical protein BpHYR1_031004 [Brachionus plicatilis]